MRLTIFRQAKLGSQLKELRIHLCQTGEESKGVRDFITNHYVQLKKENPKLPILIRECSGTQPKLWARFEYGKEKSVPLTNVGAAEISKQIQSFGNA
uniref:NADH dehydrogenase [ubiquinone] 1 alpha subcomplex subunit 2 n=1 Tax=Corethrella appendiculata TaxID=1370023 RepID=U5EQ10_9DIPT